MYFIFLSLFKEYYLENTCALLKFSSIFSSDFNSARIWNRATKGYRWVIPINDYMVPFSKSDSISRNCNFKCIVHRTRGMSIHISSITSRASEIWIQFFTWNETLLYKLQYIWFPRNQNMHTKRRGMIFSWNYLVEQCKCILFFVKSTAWERKVKKIMFEIFPWNQMDHKSLGIISWNHVFSNFFGENVTFTNFFRKCLKENFSNFYTLSEIKCNEMIFPWN